MPRPRSPSDAQAAVRKAALRLTEADVQRTVIDALKTFGYRYVHFRAAQVRSGRWVTPYTGHDGFPDLIAVKHGRMLALELKGSRGTATDDQEAWIAGFEDVLGCYARVVRPDNMDDALAEIAR